MVLVTVEDATMVAWFILEMVMLKIAVFVPAAQLVSPAFKPVTWQVPSATAVTTPVTESMLQMVVVEVV